MKMVTDQEPEPELSLQIGDSPGPDLLPAKGPEPPAAAEEERLDAEKAETRQIFLFEIIVLLVLISPTLMPRLSGYTDAYARAPFWVPCFFTFLHEFGMTLLLLFFLWRNGEAFAAIGLHRARWGREALLGAGLFIPYNIMLWGAAWAFYLIFGATHPDLSSKYPAMFAPKVGLDRAWGLLMCVSVALGEEIMFRGYLLHRFRFLLGGPAKAVVLSTVLFALGHGYQGGVGIFYSFCTGVVFSLVYLWRGSLTAPIVMHFIHDALSILVAPQYR